MADAYPAGSGAYFVDQRLKADLHKSGIEMKIHDVGIGEFLALLHGPPSGWDSAGIGIEGNAYPTGEDEFGTQSFENLGGYSDPIMDKLIEASIYEPSLEALYNYETYTSAQQPVIFIPRERAISLVTNRLHGLSNLINVEDMIVPDQLSCVAPD